MRPSIAAALLVLLGACAHQNVLLPAPGAKLAPDGGALGDAAGVRVDVKGDAWKGDPSNLGDYLTPVLVEITNDGHRPMQVRYSNFGLVGQSGFRYAALPPFQPMGTAYGDRGRPDGGVAPAAATPVAPPARHAAHREFFVAPYQAAYFGYFAPWPYPFAFDQFYWGQYYYSWVEPLPTKEMMNDALPEGVLKPGGSIGGFVYFQNVAPREGRLTFVANLVDAETQGTMGEIRIPLVTARE